MEEDACRPLSPETLRASVGSTGATWTQSTSGVVGPKSAGVVRRGFVPGPITDLDCGIYFDYYGWSIESTDVGRRHLISRSRSAAIRLPESGAAMRSSTQGTAVRLRLGAILSLLCAPAPSARAGCAAHYLTLRTQAAAETFAVDPLILSGSVLPPRDELPPLRPTPCSGALCSGNPAVPLSPASSVVSEGDGDWAISLRPPLLADPGSVVRSVEEVRLVPVNHPSLIFHPPRRPSPRPTT
jgi:hypothetical protein